MEDVKYDVWDWIITKSGDVRQITHDDMMDLKHEDIERHATMEEMPVEEAKKRIRQLIDKHAGVTEARDFLDKYDSMGKFKDANAYSEYTALKAIRDAINHYKYDYVKTCICKERIGETWCCNQCGLPVTNVANLNEIKEVDRMPEDVYKLQKFAAVSMYLPHLSKIGAAELIRWFKEYFKIK